MKKHIAFLVAAMCSLSTLAYAENGADGKSGEDSLFSRGNDGADGHADQTAEIVDAAEVAMEEKAAEIAGTEGMAS